MSDLRTSELYQDILRRFAGVRRKEIRIELLFGLQVVALVSLGVLLAAVLSGELLFLGVTARTVIFLSAVCAIAGVTAWFLGRPLLRLAGVLGTTSDRDIAGRVGKHFPAIRDRLLDAIQMYEQRASLSAHYSVALIDASFTDLWEQIRSLNFSEALSDAGVRRLRKFVGYAFAVVLLLLVVSPSGFFTSFYRLAHFQETFAEPLPVRFTVQPGTIDAVRGQTIEVTIRTEGKPVSSVTLFTRPQGQIDFDRLDIPAHNGVCKTALANLRNSTEYYATAADVQSDHYRITVIDRPLIRSFQLTLTPPGYTRLPKSVPPENAGDLSAYPGTRVAIRLEANKPIGVARLVFRDSSVVALNCAGVLATGSFFVTRKTSYHFQLVDHGGLENSDPIEYAVTVVPDGYPSVEIVSPGKNIDLTQSMTVDLFVRAKDDFGFSKLQIAWRLAKSRYEEESEDFTTIDLPLQAGQTSPAEAPYHWDLSGMQLAPEDVISYYAEVFDNDNVSGPKSAKSETFQLRLPSLEEMFSDVATSHEQSVESMQQVAKEAEQLKQDVEQMQREMRKSPSKPDWQQQKKADQMSQRYEAMKKKVEEATAKLDEMMKKMDDNNLLSDKTMEKYEELQKLMKELNSPELQEAMKKLQESMKQLSPEQMRQAMDQLKFSEEQFRQNLERTIELLKRVHIEQKVDEVLKRTEELTKQQAALQNETKSASPEAKKRSELAKKQADLKKQADELKKEAADLQNKMEEFPKEMPVKEMTEANKQLEEGAAGKKMQEAEQELEAGEMQNAGKQQEESRQELEKFRKQMQQVQKTMRNNQTKQVVDAMRKSLDDLLELSKEQEGIKGETNALDPNSRRFRENAQKQDDLRSGLASVANKMAELGKKSFAVSPEMSREMGDALQHMNQAMQQMEGRQPGSSSAQQGEAMGSMNRAAMAMQNAIDGMMQGGSGGSGMSGLMGRLGSAAGQQEGINSGTQGAMGKGQGGGMSAEQQAAYGRLAGQQSAVRKTVEDLAREAKNSGDFSKLLGDLDRIAQEMQEVQTDLEQNNVNPNTIQKQDRILSRLLDSQHSMRERDYEKRRKAETGKSIQHTSPAEIDLTTQEGRNKLREELLKVLEEKYSRDYEALIKKYFEQLDGEEQTVPHR
jgi:hypothetical protein